MDHLWTWTTWEDVCEFVIVVLEKFFIHQSFVHCLVGTEQIFINMHVSVYWRRLVGRGVADGRKKRVLVALWILNNWASSSRKYL